MTQSDSFNNPTESTQSAQPADLRADIHADILVVGGGPVGTLLSIALAQQDYQVVMVERFLPEFAKQAGNEKAQTEPRNAFDGRVLALSKGSSDFLQQVSVWSELEPLTTAIEHVHVSQQGYMGLTTLHADDLSVPALGYSVQSQDLGKVLWQKAVAQKNLQIISPAELVSFVDDGDAISANIQPLDDSNQLLTISAKLIIGADGTESKVRQQLGLPMQQKSYHAYAVLAQIETEQHPNGWSFERFTEQGPVALLPMFGHAHKAVMVCPEEQLAEIQALDDQQYIERFAEKMGERLGCFTKVSPRIAYPLTESYAPRMTKGRALLMGNASHTQHPVAAQGLNLGIRDIEQFLQVLQGKQMTQDPGDLSLLANYAASREDDHKKVMGMTDSLIQLFQHGSPLVGHLRGLGLMALQAMPGLKRRFAKFSMYGRRN
ncbi:FAD-dependent monooxygenase [Thiomicrorhabdus sediminis]|uniref:Ubiquinone biosynthesis protein n=1 Tax=Thiomicrorhabdus sediminis TaxID=2580412 RepID=A0A4P9K6B9_9GAMM|nr:FAD-dependent monooxygenase [Thiomicrorhabdus sediminis]QCU89856.1 ubiquinone biosynthesis protein [Thiomicrorhabdus sediminis]